MPEFYMIIARKNIFPNFCGHVPPAPVSYAYAPAVPTTPNTTDHCRSLQRYASRTGVMMVWLEPHRGNGIASPALRDHSSRVAT